MKPRFLAVAAQPHAWLSLRSVVRDRRLSNPNNLWCTGDGKAQFYLDLSKQRTRLVSVRLRKQPASWENRSILRERPDRDSRCESCLWQEMTNRAKDVRVVSKPDLDSQFVVAVTVGLLVGSETSR